MEDFLSKCKVPRNLHEQHWIHFFEEYYIAYWNHGGHAKSVCDFVERCFSHHKSIPDRVTFFVSLINEKFAIIFKRKLLILNNGSQSLIVLLF